MQPVSVATLLGLNTQGWSALGSMLLGVGAVLGGLWALYNYHRTRRYEAARWLQGVFKDFYLSGRFDEVRELLEYGYPERAGPLLERRITDRHVPITAEETGLLLELANLLNHFEHVLYLEQERHLSLKDRQAVFEYWFDIMNAPERAALRRYVARFGFERLAKALSAGASEYVAVYGSLRDGFSLPDAPDVGGSLHDRGYCTIQGLIYDLGEYPGLKPGEGCVIGELFEVRTLSVFRRLDEYERYDALRPNESLYLRRVVRLQQPEIDAWVYLYNGDVEGKPLIESGDWARYRGGRSP
jgi:gamma-glutamylcyclotransferase (GGCT)/AIG2-like uncharacterized protein YtfP